MVASCWDEHSGQPTKPLHELSSFHPPVPGPLGPTNVTPQLRSHMYEQERESLVLTTHPRHLKRGRRERSGPVASMLAPGHLQRAEHSWGAGGPRGYW